MSNFATEYAAARKALRTAEKHSAPIDPELAATLEKFNPAAYTECLAKMATIRATIPALKAKFDELDARACRRCNGTGEYSGPTSAFRQGKAYCFRCNGSAVN
jgi:hypothetical protein